MFDTWQFLGGLAIFLIGLYFLEHALKDLVGRPFKKFLKEQTTNPIKGVLGGTLVTAILQSSSVVSLMVLAFAGAGILALKNAIGIIFGTNLGTTVTGWLVATLGFKVDIEGFALPMVAIGGLLFVFTARHEKVQLIGKFILGFGLLFVGLDWMKESIEQLASSFDLSTFQGVSPYWFVLVGLVLTAIIQSSSAAIVIALSGLDSGIIPLEAGAAMVIGSNIGTTVTVMLGALAGTAVKKQVGLSHFLFNFITAIPALAILSPFLWFIQHTLNISDPLIQLVCFHTLFNLLGVVILLPFVGRLAKWLEKKFKGKDLSTSYINNVPPDVPEAAFEAIKQEVLGFAKKVLHFVAQGLEIRQELFSEIRSKKPKRPLIDEYDDLKQLEGVIVSYYLQVQNVQIIPETADSLGRIIKALENSMISAKRIKDIAHNIKALSGSSNDVKLALFKFLQSRLYEFYLDLHHATRGEMRSTSFEELIALKNENQRIYDQFIQETHKQIKAGQLNELEISTLLNVNREVYNANRTLIKAFKDLLLERKEAHDFDKLPEVHKE